MNTSILNTLCESIEVTYTLGFGGTIKEKIEYVGSRKKKRIKTIDTSKIVGYRILNIGKKPIQYKTKIWHKDADGNYLGAEVERVLHPKQTADLNKYYMALLCARPEISFQLSNGKLIAGNKSKELNSYYFKFDFDSYGNRKDVNDVYTKISVARKIDSQWEIKEDFIETFGFLYNKTIS